MDDRISHSDNTNHRTDGGRTSDRDVDRSDGSDRSHERSDGDGLVGWFTETFARMALAVVGLVLLLIGLSQIVGIDLFAVVGEVLSSRIGQWALVAVIGLVLIVAATRRWSAAER